MRSLFLVLLLSNLLLMGWIWRSGDTEPRQEHVALQADVPKLEALEPSSAGTGEQRSAAAEQPGDAERAPGATGSGGAGTDAEASRRCLEVGPFDSREKALQGARRYRRAGHEVSLRSSEERFEIGQWVYLSPLPSREAARQRAAELRQKGISDIYVVTTPEFRNAISLGVYSQSESVERRLAQLSSYDLDLQVRSRHGTRERFRLVVRLDEASAPGAVEEAPEGGASVRRAPCRALAGG